jgi:CheY-like chemotaxis protein
MAPGEHVRGPVLVVDDDDDFRRSLAEALELWGHTVAQASNGKQALEWLSGGGRPSVVLLDLWMPSMDGWQFRHALQSGEFGKLPIVVMTAAHTQDSEFLDVADVVEKPFALVHLLTVLERHITD